MELAQTELERVRCMSLGARLKELEVQNAVLAARIEGLEQLNRFCRREKASDAGF